MKKWMFILFAFLLGNFFFLWITEPDNAFNDIPRRIHAELFSGLMKSNTFVVVFDLLLTVAICWFLYRVMVRFFSKKLT